ncbi:RidA family protein [Phytomonospora endophytica]|uniref:Enamine deaminase RidA (YjgF/YER057c/UK114 family) n=1 Tax=Phytomonospora endophytica TaxID=714109 RepID=A0A841FP05_9ACTN|nr:RidA family protein [Phytomonospora endophytica]MBB6039051.1 enamine deaminase RidA (YjgF/YER057c/UK114 family) [Phytomonospora endophytica]GIG71480.1 enamine deaminase RidA [Phytomonospora endophytica]
MSSLRRVNPAHLAAPKGFSHAVVAEAGGTPVYLAGQTGMAPDGSIVDGGIVAQFRQALSNLLAALEAAGGTPADLAQLRIYIVDMDAYRAAAREIGAVWRELAGTEYPAMAGIGVARLWDVEALVEVEGVAVVAGSHPKSA